MENSRKVRNIVLIVILVVLAVLAVLYFLTPIFKSGLSRDDVQAILDKRNSLTSVYVELDRRSIIPDENEKNPIMSNVELYMNGEYAQVRNYLKNGKRIIAQENRATGEAYYISEDNETILAVSQPNILNGVINYDLSNISFYKKFKYLGTTKIDDRKNIIIFLQGDDESQREFVYIDEETGLITKHIFECEDYHIVDSAKIKPLNNTDFMIDVEKAYPDYKMFDISQRIEK